MVDADAPEFFALINDTWALKGQAVTAGQKTMLFAALAIYPLVEVKAGLMAHIRDPKRGQFLPMPADVIAQIHGMVADDGRPGPEEAWAQAFKAQDERTTVVWTAETADAFAIAAPVLQAGDEVGARMAFKESYIRLVGEAREIRAPIRWRATLGDDNEQRDRVLLPHVLAGRISADELARPELAQVGGPAGPALGLDSLLALPAPADASAEALEARERARRAMAATKAQIAARAAAPTPAAVAAQEDRERMAMLKAESSGRLRDYIESRQPTQTAAMHMTSSAN
ncbi:hypothetical protein J2X16_000787 [Pelomonas aquatica]|uniref:Uncharacterized protein n=1 Tax=Pelomonas aquatica TaxID=431058 RepID=A0ABU1Z4B7_9BURK|nr:hypothetical protein [Pelomonas aquatica]MDR7295466.1 hypothetical protein [Pelomonas aquatica]